MMEIIDCEQNSEAWFDCRKGIPTASMFATVMAAGKDGGASITRAKYLDVLAGEILTGEIEQDGYSNAHMERGKLMEEEARDLYAFRNAVEPTRVGFIRNGRKGGSPDSLIGDKGGLEIKTAIPSVQLPRLRKGTLPPEHKAQVQGNLWISEREWWDFVSYWPKLPTLVVRVFRDETYIAEMAKAVEAFNEELDANVASFRTYQNFKAQVAA